jgi:hypothetical protein
MATLEQTTPDAGVEAYTVGFTPDDKPITKTVADMTDAEQCTALAIAKAEMELTAADAEIYLPLAEIGYLPASLEMSLQLLAKLLPAVEARERALRLADAVMAKGAH